MNKYNIFVNNKDGENMYLAIFILIIIIFILAINIKINIKSANDTIKIYAKIGLIEFVIPHQRFIKKIYKNKSEDKINDFKKIIENRFFLNRLFNHSSLSMFYMARFTKEELYINPIINSTYLIISNQIYAFFNNHFKFVDNKRISLIYDEKYENIDYFICFKTNFISLLTAIIIRK